MARRNLFLVVSLLVMVGVLIAAVLWGGAGDAPSGPGTGPGTGIQQGAGDDGEAAGPARTAASGGGEDEDGAARREVGEFDIPVGGEPVTQVRVTGRLVDVDGAGVADVDLRLAAGLAEGGFLLRPRAAGTDGQTTRTAADGTFGFDVAADGRPARLSILREAHLLFADTEEHGLRIDEVREAVALGDLVTVSAATVVGRVVDASGRPVPDASVRVRRFAGWFGSGGDHPVDDEGRFEVAGLEPGVHWVSVAARGYVPPNPEEVEVAVGETSEEITLTVRTGASIAGTVIDDLGRPVEGARVAPLRRREPSPGVQHTSFDSEEAVETDRSGYFVLSGLEGDRVSLRASHDGHAPALAANVSVGTGHVDLRLERLGVVEGSLTDPLGEPLVGSQVVVRSVGEGVVTGPEILPVLPGSVSAETDENGHFEIQGVRPGSIQLTASGDGHLPIEGRSLQLRAGGRIENLRLVAETGAGIAAVVVDPSGSRLADAVVTVRPQARMPAASAGPGPSASSVRVRMGGTPGSPGGPPRTLDAPQVLGTATTDEEGTARVGGLPAGTVEVLATHPDWAAPRPVATTLSRSGFVETILSMRPAGSALVKVLDSDGAVVAGAPIRLRSLADGSEELRGRSDERGFARFEPLLVGDWEAVLELPPKPRQIAPGMSFSVAGDQGQSLTETARKLAVVAGDTTEVELVQPVLARIHGTVTDTSGAVAGVKVELRLVDATPLASGWETATDAAGQYELVDVPAGAYAIEWSRTGDVLPHADTLDVQSGTPEIVRDLVLGGGGIRVLVTSAADASPVAGAKVTVERPGALGRPRMRAVMMVADGSGGGGGGATTLTVGDEPNEATTDADGVAELSGVPPGSFEIVVRHSDHATRRQGNVSVVDGQVAEQAVQIVPAGSVSGLLQGFAADAPVQVAMVEVRRADGEGEPRSEVVRGALYEVGGLESGEYLVRARSLLGQTAFGPEQPVTIVAGETATVDLSLRP